MSQIVTNYFVTKQFIFKKKILSQDKQLETRSQSTIKRKVLWTKRRVTYLMLVLSKNNGIL